MRYLNTSGDGLHKRGATAKRHPAPQPRRRWPLPLPIWSRVRRDSLVGPFCGSGTLVIELHRRLNLAPACAARFAANATLLCPLASGPAQRQKALEEVRKDAAFEGIGYDIDPAAVALANANALAGVRPLPLLRWRTSRTSVHWTMPLS